MSGDDAVTVLCVDDDPDFLTLSETVLQRSAERFEIITETDPTAVLDRLSSNAVDCVVSDYDMPGMDGLELLEAIRADHPKLPFILFTGKGSEEVASEAIARGVTDYLQKGGGRERYALLANRIEHAFAQRRRDRELKRYETLFDVAPIGIFRTASDGTVYEVNEAMAALVGYDTPSAAIDAYNDLAQELYRSPGRRETFIDRLATEGTVTNFQYEARTKSGETRTFRMNATVLDESDTRPFEIVGYTWRVPESERE
ncbi:response regulator [Halorhabdus sp. CBA1104]|uniref:response regulator n=1 Tax=Halorhabdus sp. CBA1104 TaxID=1380432 RepID=UPI0012B2FB2D|nr:response regulator [Halorhabdus sp. CBA1104]QGN07106.1 response regulator [Halorhabdus sp. CBA1104]